MTIAVDHSRSPDLRAYRPKDLVERFGGSPRFWRKTDLPWRKLGARTLVVLHTDMIAYLERHRVAGGRQDST